MQNYIDTMQCNESEAILLKIFTVHCGISPSLPTPAPLVTPSTVLAYLLSTPSPPVLPPLASSLPLVPVAKSLPPVTANIELARAQCKSLKTFFSNLENSLRRR